MSQRIPIGEVLNEAFQFGRARWLTVFSYFWLPFLLIGLFAFGASNIIFDMAAIAARGELLTLDDLRGAMKVSGPVAFLIGFSGLALVLVLYAGAFTSVFRLVALGEERHGFVHLRFDGPAQRVFWAQLILALLVYGFVFVIGMIVMMASGESFKTITAAFAEFSAIIAASSMDSSVQVTPADLQHLRGPLGVVFNTLLISIPILFYLSIKLVPFLPGSASENRLLLFGAFHMTSGHAWRIFGVYIIFMIAMLLLGLVFQLGLGFVELMSGLSGGGSLALIGGLFALVGFALTLAYQVFVMGVQLALPAIIYRRLKTGA